MDMHERISLARKQAGFNKSELARNLGVSPTSIVGWELPPEHRSSSRPGVPNLAKLASILNVRFEWLATGRGEVRVHPSRRGVQLATRGFGTGAGGDSLTKDERRLLHIYVGLSAGDRKSVLALVRLAAASSDSQSAEVQTPLASAGSDSEVERKAS